VAVAHDHHATIFVAPRAAHLIEAARRRWDPVMAAQIAAHVTLAYPGEAPSPELLAERLREAGATRAPFRLRLGALACFGRPEDGVYIEVDDVDGGYRELREVVLRPPFQLAAVTPHVTIVHPRTSRRGRELWDVPGGHCEAGEAPAQALARELEEEIGVTPRAFAELAVLDEPRPAEHGEARYHMFAVTAWDGGEPRLRGPEHAELRWLHLAEALVLALAHPDYPALFRRALGGGGEPS
jgi:8-oxo-dGTP pyrophosphatase MutT (NUDIX family)